MRLLTFAVSDQPRLGLLVAEDRVLDVAAFSAHEGNAAAPEYVSMLALLQAGPAAMNALREMAGRLRPESHGDCVHALNGLKLLAPVPTPVSIRDCMSFELHLLNCTRTVARWRSPLVAKLDAWSTRILGRPLLRTPAVCREQPVYYKGNPRSVIGTRAEVVWPAYEEKLDFELEFGVFIGKQGVNIAVEDATQHIAGYCLFNDFSARETQLREMAGRLGPAKGKDFDTGNAIGPYLVTPDEVGDARQLSFTATVNGQVWTEVTAATLQFSVEEIISYISQSETLYPGEFIAVGTLPGGCGLELDRWLKTGDTVQLACEPLGILTNQVVKRS